MHFLQAQTVSRDLEIVYVTLSADCLADGGPELARLNHIIVEVTNMNSTAAARAAGVRRASAPLIALAEDHSYPESRWAEVLIASHEKPWAAVGPAIGNGNPQHALSWANLAIEYGPWLDPVPSGATDHLPGHNCSYKRDVLLEYGPDLDAIFEAESVLHWDLRSKGYELYLNADARTFHLNYSLLGPSLLLRFLGGRLFAAARARHWTVARRLVYGLCGPLILLRRLRRILADLRRIGQLGRLMPNIVFLLAILLAMDALGEVLGYFFGTGGGMARYSEMELKRERFMKSEESCLTVSRGRDLPVGG